MTRSRVYIVRSRSDQNRAIESRDDNVTVRSRTQSRKETEFFELM
jgi:IMP cyclohydrolase